MRLTLLMTAFLVYGALGNVHSQITSGANENVGNLRGRVRNESGQVTAGVTVRLKKAGLETATKVDGTFEIPRPNLPDTLQFSLVGYRNGEIPLSSIAFVEFTLSSLTEQIDEVVVIGFGLSQRKETLSSAISTVNADLLQHSQSATAAGALVGRIPGLNFRQNAGRPGQAPTLQIRNFGTPLIIIDGTVRDYASFAQLDFHDIENISVLKDGTAAIYGMQAANGAIVVTTKQGIRSQKPQLSAQTYYGVQSPFGYNRPADARTYLRAIIQDETFNNVAESSRTVTREQYALWESGTDDNYKSFDWFKYIWRPAPQIYGSINLRGGSENSDYYISAAHLKQAGMMRNFDGFNRSNVQANFNSNISRRLKVGLGVTGRMESRNQPGLPGDDYAFAESAAFRNLPTLKPFVNGDERYPAVSSIDPQYSYGWIANGSSGTYQIIDRAVQINSNFEFDIIKGLKARGLFSYWFKSVISNSHENAPVMYTYDESTALYRTVPTPGGRYVERSVLNHEEINSNIQLEYKESFGKHNIRGLVLMETRSGNYPGLRMVGSPAANDIPFLTLRDVTSLNDDMSFIRNRLGFLGRLDYDYAGKYIASFSGRYDGTYFYGPNRRFGFFPTGSVAYRVSEEEFWKTSEILSTVLNEFKIRGSYGVSGKELGTAMAYITGYSLNQGTAIVGGREIRTSRVFDIPDNITWGRVSVLDLGFDFGMFKNRLTGSFSYFHRIQRGELARRYDVLLPNEIGFALPQENLNSDHTKGFDFGLTWNDKIGEVGYFAGGNFVFSRWITGERYLPRWSSEFARYRDMGNTEGRFRDGTFQLVKIGQFQSWEEIAQYTIDQDHVGNTTIRPGDFKYQDTNGDGYITDLDMVNSTYRVNSGTPWINFAFNLGANWKNFDIRGDFVGGTGFTYEQQGYMRYFDNVANVSQYLADNSTWYNDIWDRNSGYNLGKYPLLTRGVNNWMTTHWPSSGWQTNVTYVKLRNFEFGYTFPQKVVQAIGLNRCRIYVAGENMLTISNMPAGLDPEITQSSGIAYPNPRIFNGGVQLTF